MSEIPASQLERFPSRELTPDETAALGGISYSQLPETFSLSTRVFNSCAAVWQTRGSKKGPSRSEAAKRARAYFSPLAEIGDISAQRQMNSIANFEREAVVTEIGQQFYQEGPEIVVGKIHEGKINALVLRNNLDGIPDNQSVVHTHKHPNDYPQSLTDFIGILADSKNVPERCLYLVVGPDKIHLIFPTIDSPRLDLDTARFQMREHAQRWVADRSLEYPDLVRELAQRYKLGYYHSPRTSQFTKNG